MQRDPLIERIDKLPLELIIKIASYLDEKNQFLLLKASEKAKERYPSLKEQYYGPPSLEQHIMQWNTDSHLIFIIGFVAGLHGLYFAYNASSLGGMAASAGLTLFSLTKGIKHMIDENKENNELYRLQKQLNQNR